MTRHPLAYRILASLGFGIAAVGCGEGSCEPFERSQKQIAEGCVAEAYFNQEGETMCHTFPLENGACPALDSTAVANYEEALYDQNAEASADEVFAGLQCGPLDPPADPSAGTAECCYVALIGEIPEHCPG